jgi:hypothetical protein
MQILWNDIKKNRPAIFDWLVFIISLSLGFIFPSLKEIAAFASLSVWMLVCLILYVAGVLLKRGPLYNRLALSGSIQKVIPYVFFLIVGHWVIMLFLVIFSEDAFRKLTGLPMINKEVAVSGLSVFTSIVTAAVITWLVFKKGNKKKKPLSETNLFYRELIADLLLISTVAMLCFVFWEKTILVAIQHMPINGIVDAIMLFIFLSFAYILFYLPLRYLYLIDGQSNSFAWKRLLLIFLLILIRGLFEALFFR